MFEYRPTVVIISRLLVIRSSYIKA